MTRLYHGWRITWALAITQTVGYGVLFYAFSVFIEPMEAELGWTRGQTSGAFSLALLVSGLVAMPAGRWVDKRGARGLMTLGSTLGVLLMIAWSFANSLSFFYLIQGAIGLVMAATFYEIAFTVAAVWFRRKRTQAMLIITMVAGLASTIFIPLTTFLVETMYWRDALRVLALILALGTIPLHAFVLRRRPQDLGLEPDGLETGSKNAPPPERSVAPLEALRVPTFWWIGAAFALDRITVMAIAAHSVPLLLERGYSPALVAAAAGSIGLMQLAGRMFFLPFADRFRLSTLTAFIFSLHSAALLSLLFVPGGLSVWLFAAFFGMSNGAGTLAKAALVADTYGSAHYGSINGSLTTIVAIIQIAGPLGAGALHDNFGSYIPVLWVLAVSSGLAALTVLQTQPRQEPTYAD